MNTFGSRLRQARLQRKWTQKKLAEASGLTQSAIGNYESGQRSSSRSLLRLARALGVNPNWLDTGVPPVTGGYPREDNTAESALRDPLSPMADAAPWPFSGATYQEYLRLSPRDRQMLDSLVADFIRNGLAGIGKAPEEPGA